MSIGKNCNPKSIDSITLRHEAQDWMRLLIAEPGRSVGIKPVDCQLPEDGSIDTIQVQWDTGRGWQFMELNCYSSLGLGLGTCGCHSHDPFHSEDMTQEEVLGFIMAWLRGEDLS